MIAIILVVAGIGIGAWRAALARRRRNHYSTSAFFSFLVWTMGGLGLATGIFLLVSGILPVNRVEVKESPLISVSETIGVSDKDYFVAQNLGDEGVERRSFISNLGTQTLLRNDIAIPSKLHEGDYEPLARYSTNYIDYPWLWPFALTEGGFQGQTVDLYVPSGTIWYGFHLEP